MERRQGPLSCFGDDNNAPLFHLYILRNCSVIRNNHRLKAMEDVLISALKWREINFTAQSLNNYYSFPIFRLGNLHESRHAPNLGKILFRKIQSDHFYFFLNDLQSPRPSFLYYVVFSFVINKNSFKGQGWSRCK